MTGPLTAQQARPRRRGSWTLVALATAVTVLGSGAAGAAALVLHPRYPRLTAGPAYARPVTAVRIDAPGTDVTVVPGPPGRVLVHPSLSWVPGPPPPVRQAFSGRTLTVSTPGCPRRLLLPCAMRLVIQIPAAATLRASVTSGALNAAGLAGAVHVRATSGEISLTGLRGPVWARATSGVISGISLAAAQADAAVTSGTLDLQFAIAPARVTATATSGVVSVAVPRGARYRVAGRGGPGAWSAAPGLAAAGSPRLITVATSGGSASVGYAG